MKKTIIFLLALTIAVLCAACSNGTNVQPPPADIENDAAAPDEALPDEDIEEFDVDSWILDHYWWLEAHINQKDEVGAVFGLPGMYADYIFDIFMVNSDYDENPSVVNRYGLTVDSIILFNSDEAANNLASAMLGGLEVDASGLGVNVRQVGSYSNHGYFDDDDNFIFVDTGYMQNVKKNWQSIIKDKNGKLVQPPVGGYMMFEEFTIEYEGDGGNIMYATSGTKTVTDVYLFVLVEPSPPGVDINLDHHVKVYVTFPDWTIKGSEIWLEGEGMLSVEESLYPAHPAD
jgi:hypothetical protein